ncbi:EVE domain-containing protein [Nocardioides sp.]|uniref:EVE domain-containing protein n=1 Tax=Nocardioides sp. TaxID=35761 RepID=UPI00260B5E03|nr:EVE domain-containing protein [Nocardioides sp.]MDI6910461.1 EVE domain-containing protein [Nocardioides sp.]
MSALSCETPDNRADLTALPAWLVQYSPRSAKALQRSWNEGEDFEYPAIDRHTDEIREDDIVLFWVSGPGTESGVIGWGIASGHIEELEHAKNYNDPDGPKALRDSAEVSLCSVFDTPIITRDELKEHLAFADFDLFRMANRPNAFAVTREQWTVIFARLEEVLGR